MITFFTSKARAFTVFVFTLAYLGIFILSTITPTIIINTGGIIIAGIWLMLFAIPFHWFGKKFPAFYLASVALNAIAAGFSVSEYFIHIETKPEIAHLLVGALPAVAILLAVYLMLQVFSKTKKITVTVACILNALITVGLTVLWIINGHTIFSFGFFCSLISFFFLCVFGITINHDERSVLRDISFGGFGSFIIVTVVVIFILSEGEILDGMDVLDIGDGKKKTKKSK